MLAVPSVFGLFLQVCTSGLSAEFPSINWSAAEPLRADITFDGTQDVVVWGSELGEFVLFVVRCESEDQFTVLAQTSFNWEDWCDTPGRPPRIEIVPPQLGSRAVRAFCQSATDEDACDGVRELDSRLRSLGEDGGRALEIHVPRCVESVRLYWDIEAEELVTWIPPGWIR